MPLKINVELKGGAVCRMAKSTFSVFLALDKVAKFKRSAGWIVIGEEPLRGLEKDKDYALLAERRAFL